MPKAIIYFFSGTGTTAFTAEKLKEQLILNGVETKISPIDFEDEFDTGYDIYGFGFPVYAFGSPAPFKFFVHSLPDVTGKKAFVFSTCGGASGKSEHGESKLLQQKGFEVLCAETFVGIANYPVGKIPDKETIDKFIQVNENKIANMASRISQLEKQPLKKRSKIGHFIHILFLWKGYKSFAKHAFSNENCIKCDKCVAMCPMDNISRVDDKIVFGLNCAYCLRCINNCPVSAIQYKNKMLSKLQYRGPLGNYSPPMRKEL